MDALAVCVCGFIILMVLAMVDPLVGLALVRAIDGLDRLWQKRRK